MSQRLVLRIDSFDGRDTYLHCGNDEQQHLYAIVLVNEDGNAEIIDSAYRTLEEAIETWPEAMPRQSKRTQLSDAPEE